MAVTFPRSFPLTRFQSARLELVRFTSHNELYGGATQAHEMAEPRWSLQAVALPRRDADFRAWLAWLDSLKGGVGSFYAGDVLACYPVSYPGGFTGLTKAVGGAAFTGAGDVDAVTATTITISGLPASFLLKAGDLVGLLKGANRGLHRIVEDATANGSGIVTVTVEPSVLTSVFDAASTVQFASPVCIMMLAPGSVSYERGPGPQPVSFAGIQKLI